MTAMPPDPFERYDLPFERTASPAEIGEDLVLVGSVDVFALQVGPDDAGTVHPAIGFSFASPDQGVLSTIVLALHDDQLRGLGPLIDRAAEHAIANAVIANDSTPT